MAKHTCDRFDVRLMLHNGQAIVARKSLQDSLFRAGQTPPYAGTVGSSAPKIIPDVVNDGASCSRPRKPLTMLPVRFCNRRVWKPIKHITPLILTVCYTAGLRLNEVVHLTWADVDFEHDIVRVSAKKKTPKTLAWEPKDREMRKIPVPSATTALLAQQQASCPPGHAYVFLAPERLASTLAAIERSAWNERQAVMNNIHRDFRGIVKQAGLSAPTLLDSSGKPTVSLHDLRRTCLSMWAAATSPKTVKALAGHSSEITTMKFYLSVTNEQRELARHAVELALRSLAAKQTDPKVTPKGGAAETGHIGVKTELPSKQEVR